MVSRGEARSVVEVTLAGRAAGRRMTASEMSAFCELLVGRMEFPSRRGKSFDIGQWALAWERSQGLA